MILKIYDTKGGMRNEENRPAVSKMGAEVIPGLLESIRKATSERKEYGKGKR